MTRVIATETRRVDADLNLRELSVWVRSFARASGLGGGRIDDVELCVNEVAVNVATHGYGNGRRGLMSIRLDRLTPAGLQATVVDEAGAFDPASHPAPAAPRSLGDVTVGGYGLQLVRALATELHYRREDSRNVLTMVFAFESPLPRAPGVPPIVP